MSNLQAALIIGASGLIIAILALATLWAMYRHVPKAPDEPRPSLLGPDADEQCRD